jgi:hypothetical protein
MPSYFFFFFQDLGSMTIAPTCKNWILECSSCTKGNPKVMYLEEQNLRFDRRRGKGKGGKEVEQNQEESRKNFFVEF